jgi:hypothetical protein
LEEECGGAVLTLAPGSKLFSLFLFLPLKLILIDEKNTNPPRIR